jgi:glycosyltransferase involved in cell wall biosynthesis/CDP-glycerol glycerophosphotransferase (TagB/SpsB family)
MPVYNVERYLEPAVTSIIQQSLAFSANIQLVLVNDGSKDASGELCAKYAAQYPGNILYIDQTNQGVSAARNNGLKVATGKYVTFFDADDIWSKDALKEMAEFMESHAAQVDFVAAKIKFFDGAIDSHPSNYKFKTTRVINLTKEPDNPIFHLPTCLFLRESLRGHKFDTQLTITEDAKFISDVLVAKKAYGVVSEATYNYRKRRDGTSAIGGQATNRDYYLAVPERAYLHMLDTWRNDDHVIHPFMQYSVLSDIRWRINQPTQSVLTKEEEKQYKNTIKKIIKQLDDSVILTQRNLSLSQKVFLLKMKHNGKYSKQVVSKNGNYYFNGTPLYNTRNYKLFIEFIHNLGGDDFMVEGYLSDARVVDSDPVELFTSKGVFPVRWKERTQRKRTFLGDTVYDGSAFETVINMAVSDRLRAKIRLSGLEIPIQIKTRQFSGFSPLSKSYKLLHDRLLRKEAGDITSYQRNMLRRIYFELVFWLRIMTNLKLKTAYNMLRLIPARNLKFLSTRGQLFELGKPILIVGEAVLHIISTIMIRTTHHVQTTLNHKKIWLISDRGMAAGDNGEALFRYIQEHEAPPASVYYAISRKSPDYRRVKQIGKVVNQGSLRYKLLFLLSDKIISSQADDEITNPFFRQSDQLVDLYKFKFVFLQHGVIRHDLSSWLNRFHKNIALFVTSAQTEYDSILECPYYYDKSQVLLSGLPRYDLLESKPQGKLILAPTYRKQLITKRTNKNGYRGYDQNFKQSDYFKFYNDFMNDKRIVRLLKDNNMTGELYLHPAFAAQTVDFEPNERFVVKQFPYDYRTAFREGNIMVTDYSSVVFDFAYLKKPVVYAQFDAATMFAGQLYDKGDFFSDDTDGFGPVVHTYEDLVREVSGVVSSDCVMPRKYQNRVDAFFYKSDASNSKRVYDAIIDMDNPRK